MTIREKLVEGIERGKLLLVKHDGIHNMHGAYWGLYMHLKNFDEYGSTDLNNFDYILGTMEMTDKLGYWPSTEQKAILKSEIYKS